MTGSEHAVLDPLRTRIDEVDGELVRHLAERFRIVTEVIDVKRRHAIPARLPSRVEAVVAHVRTRAEQARCPPDLAEHVWRAMMEWIIAYEGQHLGSPAQPNSSKD